MGGKNGIDFKNESLAAEISLKTHRPDLFEEVQRMEQAIDDGYKPYPNDPYHKMPKEEQAAYRKTLAQNIVTIKDIKTVVKTILILSTLGCVITILTRKN